MARKKNVPDEPELQDYNPEDALQYPEGEAPMEGDTALTGDMPGGEGLPDSE